MRAQQSTVLDRCADLFRQYAQRAVALRFDPFIAMLNPLSILLVTVLAPPCLSIGVVMLAHDRPAELPPGGLRDTFSVGVDPYRQDESLAQLMVRADHALYAAKAAGRNRVMAATAQAA